MLRAATQATKLTMEKFVETTGKRAYVVASVKNPELAHSPM